MGPSKGKRLCGRARARTLSLVCVLVGATGFAPPAQAHPDGRDGGWGTPTVTSLSPASGPAAGGATVTITGTNLTGATAVEFGSNHATSFTVESSTEIAAVSPAGSGTINVTVTTPNGTSCQRTQYTYTPAPTVTTVSPSVGPVTGGTIVTITGGGFAGLTAVDFGSTPATSFTVAGGDANITAVAPPGSGAVDVTVTGPSGTSATSAADQYAYEDPPTADITAPADNQTYNLDEVVPTTFSCAEGAFGPGLQSCTDSNGSTGGTGALDTATEGQYAYTVTATSSDGQIDTATIDYTVGPPPTAYPAVQTSPPSVTVSAAGFSGSVVPNGLATTAFFQYGLDSRYTSPGTSGPMYTNSTPPESAGSDFASHVVGPVTVTGLLPNAEYHVRLVASNSDGTVYGPDVTFNTPATALPGIPTLGSTFDISAVKGIVLLKINGVFVPLTETTEVPNGAEVDALRGSLKLVTATVHKGKTQHGLFGGAIFKLTQQRTGRKKGFVTLAIVEHAFRGAPSYAVCDKHPSADASAAALSSRTLQLLRASAHGKFTTRGRYSTATVRGTIWTVADRCDGTLTHDVTDSVAVTDFVHHKTVILHAGQSYLARPIHAPK